MPDEQLPERGDVFATSFCQFPGTDPMDVHEVVRGELGEPNLAVLPQLADRGVGADTVGRSATMLADLGFDLQPHGWRVGVTDGIDARRARSILRSDENLLADILGAEQKPAQRLKLTVLGPFSLVASLFLSNGERSLSDHGARRDIIASYAHGVREHLERLARITCVRSFTVQLDELLFSDVLDGTIKTASGYRTLRSIPRSEVRSAYQDFLAVLIADQSKFEVHPVVNLPSADEQWIQRVDLLNQAGITGLIIDPQVLNHRKWERVAGFVEGHGQIFLQVLTPGLPAPGVVEAVHSILRPWRQLGLGEGQLGSLTLMPRGDFSQSTSAQVVDTLGKLSAYAQALEQTRVDA
ncbi:hypothetical protein [Glutamicibacter sp. JC586]|uniref:hypothetical protein n=1 Tax=Glutamicibacter sp. JC586 TaxID=2590552 RepID=UPI00135A0D53|nr:hypothetical protein [Glutamicibacter sp. JC586]